MLSARWSHGSGRCSSEVGLRLARVVTESGKLVCQRCEIAHSTSARARGLLGRSGLRPGGGMLIDHAGSVHMFFMRFPIDVVLLARDRTVVGVKHRLAPWRVAAARRAAPRSNCLPEGLRKRGSKRETGSSSRTSSTSETTEYRSIYERGEQPTGACGLPVDDSAVAFTSRGRQQARRPRNRASGFVERWEEPAHLS